MQTKDIKNELITIGMSARLKGLNYIVRAVELYDNNKKITGDSGLYGIIAKEFDDGQIRVERAIRHSIEEFFTRRGVDEVVKRIEERFNIKIPVCDWKSRPSNSEFIAIINFGFEKRKAD